MNKKVIATDSAPAAAGPHPQAVCSGPLVSKRGQVPLTQRQVSSWREMQRFKQGVSSTISAQRCPQPALLGLTW
jgi:enamine deaminase RidA (YjgF/YER057c/UK114 family)